MIIFNESTFYKPRKPLQIGDEIGAGIKLQHIINLDSDPLNDDMLHSEKFEKLCWSPCGRLFAIPSETEINIWSVKNGQCIAVLGSRSRVRSKFSTKQIAWSPDSNYVASVNADRSLVIWKIDFNPSSKIPNGQYLQNIHESIRFPNHFPEFNKAVSIAWGNEFIIITHDNGLIFYDTKTKKISVLTNQNSGTREQLNTLRNELPTGYFLKGGRLFAVGSLYGVTLIDVSQRFVLKANEDFSTVYNVTCSPTESLIASSSGNSSIGVWDIKNNLSRFLEGHTREVLCNSFSHDGALLASSSADETVRIWNRETWGEVAKFKGMSPHFVEFNPKKPLLATIDKNNSKIFIWHLDYEALLKEVGSTSVIRYTSAKIVLVGESNIGKSSLAMRLAEDRYPEPSEQGTTHGMRFWTLDAEKLHSSIKPGKGQRRDVILWDFGGQDEYRLVHQLFLHDTTLALILIDPTRGRVAYEEAKEWNKALEKQFQGRKAIKLLVGAKRDKPSKFVNIKEIRKLCAECGFLEYLETSALTGRNIKSFRRIIAKSLDWEKLAMTSRPELFQQIRDEIARRTKKGEVILTVEELVRKIGKSFKGEFNPDAVRAVAEQLAVQGVIAQTKLSGGEEVLILQLSVLERYAGSIIIAARDNLRGVPALEERLLGSPQIPLPGMTKKDRVPLLQEKIVLECIIELLIRHGICYRHQQLLIFPTLFSAIEAEKAEKLPHSVSLYYDFTGAIDNIYASLVARLAISEEFGESRLYPSRIEFDSPGKGICGIQHIKYKGGQAHIDLFFSEKTDVERRRVFTAFVEDHLREFGVEVQEHQAIKCRECEREINEEVIHTNIAAGRVDVVCQWCRETTQISEGIAKIRERDPQSAQKIYALRMEIEKRTMKEAERAKLAVNLSPSNNMNEPIRLLHLSDLHFNKNTSPKTKLRWLLEDIQKGEDLGFSNVEYLVISGDVTDKGNEEGFEKAREFVSLLNEELHISAERCIFVPGNHDVQDMESAYEWYATEDKAKSVIADKNLWHREGSVIFVPNKENYPLRLQKFSDAYFHKIIAKPYPSEPSQQGIPYLFFDTGIQFLTLNSCWQIDQFYRKRSGINPDALATVISEADKQVKDAKERGLLKRNQNIFRIGVWHHSVAHRETMQNTDFIGLLQNAKVKICLHGDVHESNRELVKYWHPNRMHIAGTGSFGSVAEGRPESTPRLYNLIEIQRDFSSVRVHTRQQTKPDGAWSGWNEWLRHDNGPGRIPWYDINFLNN